MLFTQDTVARPTCTGVPTPIAIGLLLTLAAGAVSAAPIDAGEPLSPATPALPMAESRADTGPAATGTGQSAPDAVELLLRMQQGAAPPSARGATQPAPSGTAAPSVGAVAETTAGARAGARPGAEQAETPGERLRTLKSSLFGADADQAPLLAPEAGKLLGSGQDGLAEPGAPMPARAADSNWAQGTAPAPGARSGGSSLLSHPVVRFIRENRALSIGASLALLAAVWFTTHYRGRQGRRGRGRR